MPRNSETMVARFENARKVMVASSVVEPSPSREVSDLATGGRIPRSGEFQTGDSYGPTGATASPVLTSPGSSTLA
jgi:hypothetical protein